MPWVAPRMLLAQLHRQGCQESVGPSAECQAISWSGLGFCVQVGGHHDHLRS
jgi:hypothetical protein